MAYRPERAPRIGPFRKSTDLTGTAVFLCLVLLVSAIVRSREARPEARLRIDTGTSDAAQTLPPGTGYVPPRIDLSHIHAPIARGTLALPSRFDWRETGKVSPVKSQGSCGSCYAFAAIAALESRILIVDDSTFDFSENNVKECEWYGSSCSGGNDWIVAHYLTAAGTVLESCDPYVPSDVACSNTCPYRKTLFQWGVISGNNVPSTDVLKSYIETLGPVYTTMYAGAGDAWRSEFAAFDGTYTLHHETSEFPNHAVLIVGWDDDLPHTGGQGAWIVKNSWGTNWGGTCGFGTERGYFTIAYGSAAIGSNSSVPLEWENHNPEDSLLYYDEGGAGGRIGFVQSPTAWGLCKYTPSKSINIDRVEFWTLDATTDVDVYVYDGFSGGTPSDLMVSSLDNSFDLAGYHSVSLNPPLHVAGGEDVYVVVKVTNAASSYPISYDTSGPGAPGSCYLSADGSYFFEFTSGDLGIRLRAATGPLCSEIVEAPTIVDVRDVEGDAGGYVSVTWICSVYDAEAGSPRVKQYRIWRKQRENLPTLLGAGDDHRISGPYEYGLDGPAWEVVGTLQATGRHYYELTAPTHCDLSGSDTCWTYFCVTAHTGLAGEHFDSAVERGYSVNDGDTLQPPGGGDDGYDTEQPDRDGAVLRMPDPNPAGEGFLIEFELTVPQDVDLAVYDVRGRRRAELAAGNPGRGLHAIRWHPGSAGFPEVPPGLYFVRLASTHQLQTVKVILLK